MAEGIFPLKYKSGLLRDGTQFQPEYCIEGQWIRFQRGKIRSMKGLKGYHLDSDVQPNPQPSNIVAVNFQENNLIFVANKNNIIRTVSSKSFVPTEADTIIYTAPDDREILWSSEIVIFDNEKHLVYLGTYNIRNINDNSAPIFLSKKLIENDALIVRQNIGVDPRSNGGSAYSSPYLFLYGTNGFVQYSQPGMPFMFTGDGSGSLQLPSYDKVIFGAPIRGGSNSPSMLFWTLSSVVRVTNVGTNEVEFKTDMIARDTSILSSRAVVEYGGLFFWPGKDNFFVYNGIVDELPNNINLNFFYDNLDREYAQNVFGVRMPQYGEIWWFYPELVRGVLNPTSPSIPRGVNTRVLIYNKKENTWYDTSINRDAAIYSDELGIFIATGRRLLKAFENDQRNYIWQHEVGRDESVNLLPSFSIEKNFTTPYISWAAFNPFGKPAGEDRWIELRRVEYDFVNLVDPRGVMRMVILVVTREYPTSFAEFHPHQLFEVGGAGALVGKLDMNIQGRNLFLSFSSTDLFEVGNMSLLLDSGDGQ